MKARNVNTFDRVDELVEALQSSAISSYDIETQVDPADQPNAQTRNLEDWHPSSRVVSVAFTLGNDPEKPESSWVVPLAHPVAQWYTPDRPDRDKGWKDLLEAFCLAMQHGGAKIIAQNGKFDLRWTYSMTGVALEDQLWFDPMAAAYALDENQPKSLKVLAPNYLGVPRWDDVNLRTSDKQPWRQLGVYNARDTLYAYQLVAPMMADLKEDPRIARVFHYLLMPITRVLVKIERQGLRPDIERVKERIVSATEHVEMAENELIDYARRFIGEFDEKDINWHPSSKFFRIFMDKSGAPVYEHTGQGKPSWNKTVLNRLAGEGAEYVQHLLAFREHSKDLSFLNAWETYARFDGRIHPTFNPMRFIDVEGIEKGTVTGRLSSSNPNAQQIPRRLKSVFGAEDGWLFVEADYAQIELRIGAMVFKVSQMLEAFEQDLDLHTLFASDLTGKPMGEITKNERQHAKAGNFGFLYGMGAAGFVNYAYAAYGVEVSLIEAQKIRTKFFQRWADLEDGHDRIKELARLKGYAVSPLGRIRRVPEIHSSNDYKRSRAERQAINSVVQSFASDLMLLTLIDLTAKLDPDQARIVGTVHDSILFEVRKDSVKKVLTQVSNVMLYPDITRRFGCEITVPLAVEFKIGRHWADENAKTIEVKG